MWHFFITKLQNKFTHKKFTNQYQIKTSIATDSQTQASKIKIKKKIHKPTHKREKGTDPPLVETQALATADESPSPSHCQRQPLTGVLASLAHWKQTNLLLCPDWKQILVHDLIGNKQK